jgi:hypothetical protein
VYSSLSDLYCETSDEYSEFSDAYSGISDPHSETSDAYSGISDVYYSGISDVYSEISDAYSEISDVYCILKLQMRIYRRVFNKNGVFDLPLCSLKYISGEIFS